MGRQLSAMPGRKDSDATVIYVGRSTHGLGFCLELSGSDDSRTVWVESADERKPGTSREKFALS
jgi:hypothetical protein